MLISFHYTKSYNLVEPNNFIYFKLAGFDLWLSLVYASKDTDHNHSLILMNSVINNMNGNGADNSTCYIDTILLHYFCFKIWQTLFHKHACEYSFYLEKLLTQFVILADTKPKTSHLKDENKADNKMWVYLVYTEAKNKNKICLVFLRHISLDLNTL